MSETPDRAYPGRGGRRGWKERGKINPQMDADQRRFFRRNSFTRQVGASDFATTSDLRASAICGLNRFFQVHFQARHPAPLRPVDSQFPPEKSLLSHCASRPVCYFAPLCLNILNLF